MDDPEGITGKGIFVIIAGVGVLVALVLIFALQWKKASNEK